MKIIAIHGDAYNWHTTTSFLHTVLFHGEALLPSGKYGIASHDLHERTRSRLSLIVNGYNLADIFLPERSCNLVVSERVVNVVASKTANFGFFPVDMKKVYTLPWSLDGKIQLPQSARELQESGREFSIHNLFPHDAIAAASLPTYYELASPNHYELIRSLKPTHRFLTRNDPQSAFESDFLPVSEELYSLYPITNPGYPVIREDIY